MYTGELQDVHNDLDLTQYTGELQDVHNDLDLTQCTGESQDVHHDLYLTQYTGESQDVHHDLDLTQRSTFSMLTSFVRFTSLDIMDLVVGLFSHKISSVSNLLDFSSFSNILLFTVP
jgi:hypothetical protein